MATNSSKVQYATYVTEFFVLFHNLKSLLGKISIPSLFAHNDTGPLSYIKQREDIVSLLPLTNFHGKEK